MSAPLRLSATDLKALAEALDLFSKARNYHGVSLTPYANAEIGIGDNVVSIAWDDEASRYIVDDRNGS